MISFQSGSNNSLFRSLFAMLTLVGISSCSATQQTCEDADKECIKKIQGKHITLTEAYWKESSSKPLLDRISVAQPEVIEFLGLSNQFYDDPFRAQSVSLEDHAELVAAVRQAVDEMPDFLKRFSDRHLAGIVLVKHLGATADVANIKNKHGKVVSARIALDVDALTRKANAWATWKENTPFEKEGEWRVEMLIEHPEHDNVKNAVQYILIHEIAHIIAAIHDIHPPFFQSHIPMDAQEHPWLAFSWQWNITDHYYSKYDQHFPQRKQVRYYFGKNLPSSDMLGIYKALEKTDFPTLYAATSPYDDWAEAFVSWVHVVEMKKPFSLKLYQGNKFQYEFELCWGKPRCKSKQAFIENFVQGLMGNTSNE